MKAQTVYDFANEGGCSDNDMHDYFRSVFDGEPSPSGRQSAGDWQKKYEVKVDWPAHALTY